MTDAEGNKVTPVNLSWRGDVPYSDVFGDIYFSEENGFAETCHTFLDGNKLIERWREAALSPDTDLQYIFRIGETGFGTGLNFLAAWHAFEQQAPANFCLSFVSVEAFPLCANVLMRAVRRWPELLPYAQRLAEIYPTCLEGWHRVQVSPRVTLTLGFGPAEAVLREAVGTVDAWFLDGFAPSKNPDMWSAPVFAQIARLSHPETTLATFTAAGFVRRGLEAVGFAMEKRPGFGRKRDMLAGVFRGAGDAGGAVSKPWFAVPARHPSSDRTAIVVGGGVAGVSAGAALRRRGWQVTLLEAGPKIADGTSGNPAPLIKPKLMQRGTPEADFYRHCYLYAMQLFRCADAPPVWRDAMQAGAVQLALTREAEEREAALIESGVLPEDDAQWLSAAKLSDLLGCEVLRPGAYFPRGGALNGPAVCRFLSDGLDIQFNARVGLLDWCDDVWTVIDEAGAPLGRSACVVLALGHNVSGIDISIAGERLPFSPFDGVFQRSVGDLFQMPASAQGVSVPIPVSFGKHVVPCADGSMIAGSTFRKVRESDSAADIGRGNPEELDLSRRLTEVFRLGMDNQVVPFNSAPLAPFWSGVRTSTPDRLPVVGPVPDAVFYRDVYADLYRGRQRADYPDGRYLTGLYAVLGLGARGFSTAYLCGDIVASIIAGDILPVPRAVMEKLHPARFLIRALRRGAAL